MAHRIENGGFVDRGNSFYPERLYEARGMVLEPVPENQHTKYRFWRGVHLGRAALNVARGYHNLSAGQEVHWIDDYTYARNVARDLVKRGSASRVQFSEEEERALGTQFPSLENLDFPVMVVALDENYNNGQGLVPSNSGGGDGYTSIVASFEALDPYSREALSWLFDTPQASHSVISK